MNKQTDKKALTNDVYNKFPLDPTTNCEELEREFAEIFGYLHSVSDVGEKSLEELLDTAIDEEEKFLAWRRSSRKLKNVRFFHKKDGKRLPVKKASTAIKLENTNETSQFEIWECDRKHNPYFPLYRLLLSKLRGEGEFSANERLRDNYSLKLKAEKQNDTVFLTVSVCDSTEKVNLFEKIRGFVNDYQKLWQLNLVQNKRCFANLLLLVFFSSILVTSLACSTNQRVFAAGKTEQILKSRSFEERYGDEKISQFISFAQRLGERQNRPE